MNPNAALLRLLDEVGDSTFGPLYVSLGRGKVHAWAKANPVQADILRRRIVLEARSGRLGEP